MHPIDRTHGRGLAAYRLPLTSNKFPPRRPGEATHASDQCPHRDADGSRCDGENTEPWGPCAKHSTALERSDLPGRLREEAQKIRNRGGPPRGAEAVAIIIEHCARLAEDRWAGEVARVRAAVAEEIAQDLAEWSERTRAQANVTWLPESKRQLDNYASAYDNAADVARRHAAAPAEPSVGSPTPDVGTSDLATMAQGWLALAKLDKHADKATGPLLSPDPFWCGPCSAFTAALLRQVPAEEALPLRCPDAQEWQRQVDAAIQLAKALAPADPILSETQEGQG